ncbi:MAG: hypothetical protein WCX83_05745 [Candidatus Cloacimonas sp.]
MEEIGTVQLTEKVQQLIDNFRSLRNDHNQMTVERDSLVQLRDNNTATIYELKSKVADLEEQLLKTLESLEQSQKKCNEYEQKIANFENITKTASTKLDDILSQINALE